MALSYANKKMSSTVVYHKIYILKKILLVPLTIKHTSTINKDILCVYIPEKNMSLLINCIS